MSHDIADNGNSAAMKKIDIDFLIQEFNAWQQQTEILQKDNQILTEKVVSSGRLLESSQSRERQLEIEVKDAHHMVEEIQSLLSKRCDKDDENRLLQETIKDLQADIEKLNKTHQEEKIRLEKCLEDNTLLHKDELEELRQSLTQIAEKENRSFQSVIEERDHTVRDLRRQVTDTERETQTELIRLRIEYDAKLVKLQTQLSKAQQNSHTSTTQDIFRKKLQHLKEESEREIGTLKTKITELEERLQRAPPSKQPIALHRGPPPRAQPLVAPTTNAYPYKRPRKY